MIVANQSENTGTTSENSVQKRIELIKRLEMKESKPVTALEVKSDGLIYVDGILCDDQKHATDILWEETNLFEKKPGIYPIPNLRYEVRKHYLTGETYDEYAILSKDETLIRNHLLKDNELKLNKEPVTEGKTPEAFLKEVAIKFFYWWYNTKGNNTEQGFDDWIQDEGKKYVDQLNASQFKEAKPEPSGYIHDWQDQMTVAAHYAEHPCKLSPFEHNKAIFHLGQCHTCYSKIVIEEVKEPEPTADHSPDWILNKNVREHNSISEDNQIYFNRSEQNVAVKCMEEYAAQQTNTLHSLMISGEKRGYEKAMEEFKEVTLPEKAEPPALINELMVRIEKECQIYRTSDGSEFTGISWAEVATIFQVYGYKLKPPF